MAWEDPGTSALIVDVPAAVPIVGGFRRELTPSGRDGMPPHITLLAPFTPGPLAVGRIREVREVLQPFAAFSFALVALDRFEDGTLYLAPEPSEPFVAMHEALVDAFPERRPRERREMVPHLTVSSGAMASAEDVATASKVICGHLPVAGHAREVLLMVRGPSRRWSTRSTVELVDLGPG